MKKILNSLLQEIAKLEGKAISREQAIKLELPSFYYLEYASEYGGYRVVSVTVNGGAHWGAFGGNGCEPRLKATEMRLKLESILTGLNLKK